MIFNVGSCGVDTDHDRSIRRALNKSVYQIMGMDAEGDEKRAIWKVMRQLMYEGLLRGGSEHECAGVWWILGARGLDVDGWISSHVLLR